MCWGDQGSLDRRWGLALGVQSLGGYNSKGTSQVALVVKNLPANAGDIRDMGLIPGLGKSPGVGNVTLFQYSCLENSMNRGA